MTYGPKVKQTNNVGFDYKAEAELFPARNRRSTRQRMGYRRFAHAADAVRFAIEELNPEFFLGADLEVDEERYDGPGIRRLYESADYPLDRRGAGLVQWSRAKPVKRSYSVVHSCWKVSTEPLPPGTYRVVTDEEQIEELPFPVYRRVATVIFVPAESGNASAVEMVTIDPRDLQATQELDLKHAA
jgi:hypothetical protein